MLFSAPGAWSPAFCREVRAAMDRGDLSPAEIFDGAFVVDRQVRDVMEVEVADTVVAAVEARIAAARDEIASFLGLSLHAAEGPGFLRYRTGGFYKRHCDRADADAGVDARRVSLVVFLNDASDDADEGFAGGSLRIYPGDRFTDVVPKTGLLVAFPADIPHEVLRVTRGVRDVVVDWYL